MSDRPLRETNRSKIPGGPAAMSATTVRLIAHDNALRRRLAWRFESQGVVVVASKFAELEHAPLTPDSLRADFVIVDIGWTDAEISAAMPVVFQLTSDDALLAHNARVVVLAPWFDPATRPAWAELGVWLVLDRTTPPPRIAEIVMRRIRS